MRVQAKDIETGMAIEGREVARVHRGAGSRARFMFITYTDGTQQRISAIREIEVTPVAPVEKTWNEEIRELQQAYLDAVGQGEREVWERYEAMIELFSGKHGIRLGAVYALIENGPVF